MVLLPTDDGHQGGGDRQAHGDQRAEGDREDDDRHQDADQLAVAGGCLVRVAEATVVLDLDACVTHGLDGLLGGVELGAADLLEVEADRGEGGLTVFTEGRSSWVVGTAHRDHVRTGGELLDGLLDRGLLVRTGEAVLRVEDDVRGVERLLREAVLDGVGRGLRLRAGQAERLVVVATGGGVEHEDRDRDDDPGADDAPRVAAGEVADAVEEVGHGGSLVVGLAGSGQWMYGAWKERRNSRGGETWGEPHVAAGGPHG